MQYDTEAFRITMSLYLEGIEDGFPHPGEGILKRVVEDGGGARDAVRSWVLASAPRFGAEVLRLLGRLARPFDGEWRVSLIEDALGCPDVGMRDAAIQAAEQWGDEGIVSVLRSHEEPAGWLRDYIRQVIADLSDSG